jgi:hypothetical protein
MTPEEKQQLELVINKYHKYSCSKCLDELRTGLLSRSYIGPSDEGCTVHNSNVFQFPRNKALQDEKRHHGTWTTFYD